MIKTAAALVCAATLVTACASNGQGINTAAPSVPTPASSSRADTPIDKWYVIVRHDISRLEESITFAQRVIRRPDHRGLTAACQDIRRDVTIVRAEPKAPDAQVRHALAREADAFDAAAVQCLSGDYHPAGHSVNVGHRWAAIGGRRLRALLDLPPKTGALL